MRNFELLSAKEEEEEKESFFRQTFLLLSTMVKGRPMVFSLASSPP